MSQESQPKVVYIGVAIPLDTQIPMLFNESISTNLEDTAIKTRDFLTNGGLNLDTDVKMSVIPIDENLLSKLNETMPK